MLTIVIAGLRHRAAALLSILMAAGLGSALIVLCGAMFETGIRLSAPPQRVGGADLVVIGEPSYTMLDRAGEKTTDSRPYPERHRLPEGVVAEAGGVDGVAHAIPINFDSALAAGRTASLTLTAQNWASVAASELVGPEGTAPAAGEIVLTAAAATALDVTDGDSVSLTVAGETATRSVHAVIGDPSDPATAFVSDSDPTTASGSLDALGIRLEDRADVSAVRDSLDAALGSVRVLAGDGRGAAEDPAVSASRIPTIVIGAVFGGIVLTVLATVVSGIIALSVRQRSREISLLRATGATGRQVRALLVREAVIVGTAGALAGLALGVPLAYLLFAVMRDGGVVPQGLELRVGLIPFAIALSTTVFVLWFSARLAARPLRRFRAIDALREAELPRARIGVVKWLLGGLFGLGAIALAIITTLMPPALVSATAGPAVLAGAISAALLAPAILRMTLALTRPVLGNHPHSLGGLARTGARARIATLATVTGAAALVVGLGVGNLVPQALLASTSAQAQVETITATAVVNLAAGASDEQVTAIAALPEVDAVSPFVTSGGWIERPYDDSHRDWPWPIRGLDGSQVEEIVSNRLVAGSFANLTGQTLAVPDRTAADLGVTIGDTVRVRFGDGEGDDLQLVATYEDLTGYENLILPVDLLAAHTTARAPRTVLVSASDGVSDGALVAALEGALSEAPGVTVGDRDELESALQEGLNINAFINTMMLLVVLAYAMIAVINTVALSTLGRRRELAMLRLAGATREQVRALLLTETSLATVAGLCAGLVVASAAILPTAFVVRANPASLIPLGILLAVVIAVFLITLPITALAGRRAMAGRPADTIVRGV